MLSRSWIPLLVPVTSKIFLRKSSDKLFIPCVSFLGSSYRIKTTQTSYLKLAICCTRRGKKKRASMPKVRLVSETASSFMPWNTPPGETRTEMSVTGSTLTHPSLPRHTHSTNTPKRTIPSCHSLTHNSLPTFLHNAPPPPRKHSRPCLPPSLASDRSTIVGCHTHLE